ncbi:MAG: hypothetical protein PHC62_03510, partial [Candidatus Izemoplasmatales bacterium]|nr:hypothetical protein [Candidatus Izemoplasmatales bacterium]
IQYGNTGAKFSYALFLFNDVNALTNQKRKDFLMAKKAIKLFIDYSEDSDTTKQNQLQSMEYVALAFEKGIGVKLSLRASRYWTERAAEGGLSSSMVKMFHLLKDKEPNQALIWLQKAVKNNDNPEAFYEIGNCYLTGFDTLPKDLIKAKENYELSANFQYPKALEILVMM